MLPSAKTDPGLPSMPWGAPLGHSWELPCPPYCYHLPLSACTEVCDPSVGCWASSGTSMIFSHLRMFLLTSMSNRQFTLCLSVAGTTCDSSWVVNTGTMTAIYFKIICSASLNWSS